MATIRHTHGWDLLYKFALMAGLLCSLLVGCGIYDYFAPQISSIDSYLYRNFPDWVYGVTKYSLMLAGIVSTITIGVLVLTYSILPEWLPTFLYAFTALRTRVSISEARRLTFLFDGSLYGKWYPLRFIAKLDSENRREALCRLANKISTELDREMPFPEYDN